MARGGGRAELLTDGVRGSGGQGPCSEAPPGIHAYIHDESSHAAPVDKKLMCITIQR